MYALSCSLIIQVYSKCMFVNGVIYVQCILPPCMYSNMHAVQCYMYIYNYVKIRSVHVIPTYNLYIRFLEGVCAHGAFNTQRLPFRKRLLHHVT